MKSKFQSLSELAEIMWREFGPPEGAKLTDKHVEAFATERSAILADVGASPGSSRWFTVEFAGPVGVTQTVDGKPGVPFNAPSVQASCWQDALLKWAVWPQAHGVEVVDARRLVYAYEPVIWDDVFEGVAA